MSESAQEPKARNAGARDGDVPVEEDVETDPAMDDGNDGDWAGEGGAVPDGPATDTTDS